MPNRRAHDYIGQLTEVGIPKKQVQIIVQNLEKFEKSGITLKNISIIANKIVKDLKFRNDFFEDPLTAINKIGIKSTDPQPDIPGK